MSIPTAGAAAIYLVHLNPMTVAHESIISMLKKKYHIYIFPVRFVKYGQEINTKSLPFSYSLRKEMIESVFGDSVVVCFQNIPSMHHTVSIYRHFFPHGHGNSVIR